MALLVKNIVVSIHQKQMISHQIDPINPILFPIHNIFQNQCEPFIQQYLTIPYHKYLQLQIYTNNMKHKSLHQSLAQTYPLISIFILCIVQVMKF
ncbi:UNKNOWN [Stylonychia lemnae]|uniref:Transmembrane protein n=1 Tax=Stylonychia lemnae TaxID=5949 RepID=A0A078A7X6_STYLE|nr:UNKNOWN [Stylonychia lemnae]|eukprot:CDW78365.1 UNKNOWN [Stylonychia lemnae]